jgi:hypothetical protein
MPAANDEGSQLKPPDVFTGRDAEKLPPFITQCSLWFMAKPNRYATDVSRVLFAASYLRDLADKWWMPVLAEQPRSPILDSWYDFTAELFDMFGDRDIQQTAQDYLLALKMEDDDRITEYVVGFNSQAAYSGWNDCGLTGQFYRNLPNRIKDQFQFVDKPNTLSGVRNFATTFD